MSKKEVIEDKFVYIFQCPHCDEYVEVEKHQVNCSIFRHGAYRANTNVQVHPHASKQECDRLYSNREIYGCGKPFRFISADRKYVEPCDYI